MNKRTIRHLIDEMLQDHESTSFYAGTSHNRSGYDKELKELSRKISLFKTVLNLSKEDRKLMYSYIALYEV